MTTIRTLILALAMTLTALALSACGEKEDVTGTPAAERFTVVLDYLPNADHVGLYQAVASGEMKRAGLDVRIQAPPDPSAPLKLLAAGRADLAISYEPEVLLARDKGAKVISVGALVQKPLTSIMSIGPRPVRRPQDLRGKTIATAGIPYQDAYLDTILDTAGVPRRSVKRVNVGFKLTPALLSRRADASLGAFWNYEGVDLRLRKRRPTIIRMEQAGVPTYNELVLVARQDDLPERGAMVRRFLRALGRGHRQVRANPDRGVDALVAANPDLSRRLQLESVKATLPVFFPPDPKQPFGFQDRAQWTAYAKWMRDHDLLRRPLDGLGPPFTNDFLPGQGI